jgi:hypothetical protein
LEEFAPAQIIAAGNMFARFADGHFRNCFHDPLEIFLTNPRRFTIGRRIAKVDRDRHALANGKFDCIQVVTEILIQPQHTFFHFLENLTRRIPFGLIAQMKGMPRLVRHDSHVPLID